MSHYNILFGVSGSIAAFKAAATISKLVKEGHTVQVVATANALKFVGAATFEGLTGRPVFSDVFSRGQMMDHIHLARWANAFVIAPASAATLNRLAYGIAEDAIVNLFLAIEREKPVIVAPAMNTQMYSHPTVQEALVRLRGFDVKVVEPGEGLLACGEVGAGRMAEPEEIIAALSLALGDNNEIHEPAKPTPPARGNVVITSGGTREFIDGVRALTNFSTGKTGAALAEAFTAAGYAVTFIHAKNSALPNVTNIDLRSFDTYADLEILLADTLKTKSYSAILHLAAVSDFTVDKIDMNGAFTSPSREIKLGSDKAITLHLKQNPKLVTQLKNWSKNRLIKIIAYKLTNTPSVLERDDAITKLIDDPGVDFVVHNDLSEITESAHPFRIYGGAGFTRSGKTKQQMAQELVAIVDAPVAKTNLFEVNL
jgi:phosphopantothenoylcysteine decarboxylase / phosphopantothenate---cysteine ligase